MKKKLIFLFLSVVCFPIILSGIVISSLVTEKSESILIQRLNNNSDVAVNIFEQFVNDISLKTRIISQLKDIKEYTENNNKFQLIRYLSFIIQDLKINFYNGIIEIYDKNGNLLVSEPKITNKMTENDIVLDSLKGEVKNYYSIVDNKIKFTSVYPLFVNNSPTPQNVVSVSFYISNKLADEIKKLTNSEIIIFNKENDKFEVTASTFIENGERYYSIFDNKENSNLDNFETKINKESYLFKISSINTSAGTFYIGVALEKKSVTDIVNSLQTSLYIIGTFAIFFALILAYIFSKSITKPIESLVNGVEDIGKGDLDKELKIKTNDEFEFLSNSFNNMRIQIRQMIEELSKTNIALDKKVHTLSTINEINQLIIKQSGDNVLKDILKLLVNNLEVERVSIMIIDSSQDKLMLKFAYLREDIYTKNVKEYISFEIGEGIAGYVAETGESILSNDPDNDHRFKKYESEDLKDKINNIICVPLLEDHEKTLGVINIVNKEGGFNEEDKILLQSIARQVAVAFQNINLYEQAITDGMTKLYIHRYFQLRLETEIKRAERYSSKVSLIMFDIDHFKKFNDKYGHPVGDKVIKSVAEIIKQTIREDLDIAARYGGEEFAVILPETDIEGAKLFAERLRVGVEKNIVENEGEELKVTISLGCAEFPTHAVEKSQLIKKADEALYKSKEKGRNAVSIANKDS